MFAFTQGEKVFPIVDTLLFYFPHLLPPFSLLHLLYLQLEKILSKKKKEEQNKSNISECEAIFYIIGRWISDYPQDWKEDLIEFYKKFTNAYPSIFVSIEQLFTEKKKEKIIERKSEKKREVLSKSSDISNISENESVKMFHSLFEVPFLTNQKLYEHKPYEVAIQLTLLEVSLLKSIDSREFLRSEWKSFEKNAKTLANYFNWFNETVQLISLEILNSENQKQVLHFWLQVAFYCNGENLNNFNAILEILLSILNCNIEINGEYFEERDLKIHENLSSIFNPQNNFSKYKDRINQITMYDYPFVPYIGFILENMKKIKYSQSDTIDGLFNLSKAKYLKHLLVPFEDFLNCADSYFSKFKVDSTIQTLLLDDSNLEKESYPTTENLSTRSTSNIKKIKSPKLKKIAKVEQMRSMIKTSDYSTLRKTKSLYQFGENLTVTPNILFQINKELEEKTFKEDLFGKKVMFKELEPRIGISKSFSDQVSERDWKLILAKAPIIRFPKGKVILKKGEPNR